MKKMLPLLFSTALLLGSCSKSSDSPQPTATTTTPPLTGAAWVLQSESTLTTPKNGTATTTSVRPIVAGSGTVTFRTDGTYSSTAQGQTGSGTYTYAGTTLTLPYVSSSGVSRTQVLNVTELTASRLVMVENIEDTANRYAITTTYNR